MGGGGLVFVFKKNINLACKKSSYVRSECDLALMMRFTLHLSKNILATPPCQDNLKNLYNAKF